MITRIIVDEHGNVTAARALKIPDPRLGEAAVTAVKAWKFSPATDQGKTVSICMDVPLEFDAAKGAKSWKAGSSIPQYLLPQPAPRTAATAKNAPPGRYPEALAERRLSGEVVFGCPIRRTAMRPTCAFSPRPTPILCCRHLPRWIAGNFPQRVRAISP